MQDQVSSSSSLNLIIQSEIFKYQKSTNRKIKRLNNQLIKMNQTLVNTPEALSSKSLYNLTQNDSNIIHLEAQTACIYADQPHPQNSSV